MQSGEGSVAAVAGLGEMIAGLQGAQLVLSPEKEPLLECGRALLAQGRPFVAVARSLPAAVRLVAALAPEPEDLLARAAQAELAPPAVGLLRSHSRPSAWRARVESVRSGATLALVLTPEDLAAFGVAEALSGLASSRELALLVEDVHRASVRSADHHPALRVLPQLVGFQTRVLFTDLDAAEVLSDLGGLLGLREADVVRRSADLPANVVVEVERVPSVLASRASLLEVLRRHLPPGTARAVVLAPMAREGGVGGLPASELESISGELGLKAWADPGEDLDSDASRWQALLRAPGLVMTPEAQAFDIAPEGSSPALIRLLAPAAPEVITQEIRSLARRGGGRWVWIDSGEPPIAPPPGRDQLVALIQELASAGQGEAPLAVELGALASASALTREEQALAARSLQALAGLGLLAEVRPVRLLLEVADASRFRPPFISVDGRYVELHRRYEEAKARLPLMESVRFRLEAREPHDLRRFSELMGYDVATLEGLFDDMAREGILVARLRVSGRGPNLELLPCAGGWSAVLARLDSALDGLAALERRAEQARSQVEALVEAPDVLEQLSAGLSGAQVAPLPSSAPTPRPQRVSAPTPPPPAAEPIVAPPPVREVQVEPVPSLAELLCATRAPVVSPEQVALLRAGSAQERARAAWLLKLAGDVEGAARELTPLLREGGELPVAQLIAGLEFNIYRAGGPDGDDPGDFPFPLRVRDVALRAPLLEGLAPEQVAEVAAGLFDGVEFTPTEWGSARVTLAGGSVWVLERRGASPEIEAALWLEVRSPELAQVRLARLTEGLLTLAGQGEPPLMKALAEAVLELGEGALPGLVPARQTLGRAWALALTQRPTEALELLRSQEIPNALAGDWARALIEIAAAAGDLSPAMALLTQGASPALASRLAHACLRQCEMRARCEGCPLHAGSFCPADAEWLEFVSANPLGESNDALRSRTVKRAHHGLAFARAGELSQLFARLGIHWPSPVLSAWLEGVEDGDAGFWSGMVERFGADGGAAVSRLALDRALALSPEDPRLLKQAVRLALSAGDLGAALTLGHHLHAEQLGKMFNAAGAGWQEKVQALVDSGALAEGAAACAATLLGEARRRQERDDARKALEAALGAGSLAAVVAAAATYQLFVPAESSGDRLLARVARARESVTGELTARLGELRTWPVARLSREELRAMLRDAELLGLSEVAQELRDLLQRREEGSAPRPERAPSAPKGVAAGAREVRPSRREAAPAQGDPRSNRVKELLSGDSATFSERLKQTLASAPGDRERSSFLGDLLTQLFKEGQVERAVKVVRDSGESYQRVDALDGAVARLIEQRRVPDEVLPPLKKVLQRSGAQFRQSLEQIATRENPEPWKMILSQLKL